MGRGFLARLVAIGNGFKLRKGQFKLAIRRKIFMIRVEKYRNRLHREVADAPTLETFKARLVRALSCLIKLILVAGKLD